MGCDRDRRRWTWHGCPPRLRRAARETRSECPSSQRTCRRRTISEIPRSHRCAQDPVPAQSNIEPVPERPPPVTAATVSQPEPSGPARELVKSLIDIGLQRDAMTTESVEGWHKTVADLLQLGAEAVPALGEFLQKHEDVRFDPDPAINLLGEPTLRIAFLKLLSDLPGPQNLELQEQVLRTSADPDEIAVVARQLEMQEPGKYRQAIVESATATLAKARKGESPGHDDSPLVKILEQYGNSGVK